MYVISLLVLCCYIAGCTLNVNVTDLNKKSIDNISSDLGPSLSKINAINITSGASGGIAFSKLSSYIIEIKDQDDQLYIKEAVKVKVEIFSSSTGQATIYGTKEIVTTSGIADFSSLAIDLPGNYSLRFYIEDNTVEVKSSEIVIAPLNLTVQAFFPNYGLNFMDYVSQDPKKLIQDQEDRNDLSTKEYFHGGEIRKILLPEDFKCQDISINDALNSFEWRCHDETNQPFIYSVGLKRNKGLRDLLEVSSFKDNKVSVIKNGVLIAESNLSKWWSNTVTPLTLNSGGSDGVLTLSNSGTIYTVSASGLSRGIQINAERIALVTLGSATISNTPTLSSIDCNTDSAGIQPCFVSLLAGRSWLEATLNFNLAYSVVYTGTGQFGFSYSPLSRIHNSEITMNNTTNVGLKVIGVEVRSGYFKMTDSYVKIINGQLGVYAAGGYYGNYSNLKITGSSFAGFYTSTSAWYIKANELAIMNSAGDGYASAGFHNYVMNSKFVNNGGDGVRIYGDSSSLQNSLIINNSGVGVSLSSGDSNYISGNTIYNNAGDGILIASCFSFEASLVENNLITNNLNGVYASCSKINFSNNLFRKNSTAISIAGSATDLVWSGKLILDNNSANCNITSSGTNPGLTHLNCDNQGTSTAQKITAVDTSSYVVGATSDSINVHTTGSQAYSSLTDWLNFENFWRAWTLSPSTSKGRCASTSTCQIYDFSLTFAATEILNINGLPLPNQNCPASISGEKYHKLYISPDTIYALPNAIEVFGDLVGNDNGYCESGETCIFKPHVGSYQGNTSVSPKSCHFESGSKLQNVKVLYYEL